MNQPEVKHSDSWIFFDRIYCISLDGRSDRRELARKQFAAIGILERVEFVIVEKHPEDQEKGIFESHIICLKKGLEQNAQHILIFEDDVFFQRFDQKALGEALDLLGGISGWNALFLGCITNGSRKTRKRSLVKIKYRCLSHAYGVHHAFAKRIIFEQWDGTPYDMVLQKYNSEFYALYPMCAFQGLSGTDNQTVLIDRLRRFLGGLPFIQKANELYQNHKVLLLLSHAAIVLLIFLVYWCW